jgi:hypothetical protein
LKFLKKFTKKIMLNLEDSKKNYKNSLKLEYTMYIEKTFEKVYENIKISENEILKVIPEFILKIPAKEFQKINFELINLFPLIKEEEINLKKLEDLTNLEQKQSDLKNNKRVKFNLMTPKKIKDSKKFITSTKKQFLSNSEKLKKNKTFDKEIKKIWKN